MIIDANMHWLPPALFSDKRLLKEFTEVVPRAYGDYITVRTLPGTDNKLIVMSKPRGFENVHETLLQAALDKRLYYMEKAGIDKAILRICIWQEFLASRLELCKKVNDMMAAYVAQYPDKFFGLAVVPPWGDEESLDELDRAIKDLKLVGVLSTAKYGTLYLDSEEFEQYFKKINQLDVPVCVHHTPLPVEYNTILEYTNLRKFYGRHSVQLISLLRILYSGILDKFPNLKLVFTHLGGGFFAYTKFFVMDPPKVSDEVERFEATAEKVRKYLNQNIYFDISNPTSWSKAQLECAVKEVGADHILFGSSYPVRLEWLLYGVHQIQSLQITEKEKRQILGENASKLFNIR